MKEAKKLFLETRSQSEKEGLEQMFLMMLTLRQMKRIRIFYDKEMDKKTGQKKNS